MFLLETPIGSAVGKAVLSGQRRGLAHAPTHYPPLMNAVDRGIARLNAYLHRQDSLNPVVVARTLEWLLKQPTIKNQADLARRLHVDDETWICKMLTILRLPAGILAQVATLQLRRGGGDRRRIRWCASRELPIQATSSS